MHEPYVCCLRQAATYHDAIHTIGHDGGHIMFCVKKDKTKRIQIHGGEAQLLALQQPQQQRRRRQLRPGLVSTPWHCSHMQPFELQITPPPYHQLRSTIIRNETLQRLDLKLVLLTGGGEVYHHALSRAGPHLEGGTCTPARKPLACKSPALPETR